MSLARELARRIIAMRAEELPPQALAWSKVALLEPALPAQALASA
jgi:hypothetical protein